MLKRFKCFAVHVFLSFCVCLFIITKNTLMIIWGNWHFPQIFYRNLSKFCIFSFTLIISDGFGKAFFKLSAEFFMRQLSRDFWRFPPFLFQWGNCRKNIPCLQLDWFILRLIGKRLTVLVYLWFTHSKNVDHFLLFSC